ncbi:MAG: radical SAM protein [Thermoplasmata archaeon]|nr:MAG: radical SAM protein [Thermoplasmata archaeon]
MRILETTGSDELATVYVAALDDKAERIVEFVQSTQPPVPSDQKLVLIVSTMLGCPVECLMCDAGGNFHGKLSKDEIMEQIDFLIKKQFNGNKITVPKLKIQFARMGEPAFNPAVIDVMTELPEKYDAPGLMPCISTIAPAGAKKFFDRLLEVKQKYYNNGMFQLQFSIHTTDQEERDRIIPCKKWSFEQIAEFGQRWFTPNDRKITLNFAPIKGMTLDPNVIREHFHPDKFAIKLTPVNPTYRRSETGIEPVIETEESPEGRKLQAEFEALGYDVILSIGELAENKIGSNCGFYVSRLKRNQQ